MNPRLALRHRFVLGLVALLGGACGSSPGDAISLAPTTLPLGLVAHYDFDEGSGTQVLDSSGNLRHGSLNGGTFLQDGRFEGALHLGAGESVTVPQFPDATSAFTVSAWVRLNRYVQTAAETDERWGTIVSTEAPLQGGWELVIEHNQAVPAPNFAFWKGPYQGDYYGWTCPCMGVGEWTHLVAIVDRSAKGFWFYVNEKLAGTATIDQGILPGSQTLTMGQLPSGGRELEGDIDEIAIWNRTLVPAELELLATHEVSPPR